MKSKELHRIRNLQYYHNRRELLIQQLGGKCAICGSTENLEFDHIDSTKKSFSIGNRIQNSIDNIQSELNKCQLLCHNCHVKKSKEHKDINVKIDKDVANQICEEYATTNLTQKELGKKYGLAQTTVSSIVRGERWSDETSAFDRSMIPENKVMGSQYPKVAVDKIDPLTGEVVCTYGCIADAIRDGHAGSHISDCCNGKKKTHHGFIWKKHI